MVSPSAASPEEAGDASSPTSTIRNVPLATMPAVMETSSESSTPPAAEEDAELKGAVQQQQELGKGRPGREGGADLHRPPPIHQQSSPANTSTHLTPGFVASPRRPASVRSYTAEDDAGLARPPRTAAARMSTGDQTPRGSLRGMPQTAHGSSFGSPGAHHIQTSSGGTSAPRPARATRYNTSTAYPVSHPVNPANASHTMQSARNTGSMSRSASRARPALQTIPSAGAVLSGSAMPRPPGKSDDDEANIEDRGQALIRKRQQARKKLRLAKEKEREKRLADNETPETSAPPTGLPDDTFGAQQVRGTFGRSVSRTRTPSATLSERRLGSEGYFGYESDAGSATPRDGGLSPRAESRAPSVYSSTGDDEDFEQSKDTASILGDVVKEVVDGETAAEHSGEGAEDEDEDGDEDAEGSGEGDEGAINIEHPFGLPIWKPALYRKSRSVTRNAESALHSIPSAAAERHLLPSNLIWVIIFGWWLALACLFVAILVSAAEVLGGGRGGYGKTLRGLAWYIGWPFGKYVEGEGGPEEDEEEDDGENGNDDAEYGTWDRDGSPVRYRRDGHREPSEGASSGITVRDTRKESAGQSSEGLTNEPQPATADAETDSPTRPPDLDRREPTVSFAPTVKGKARQSLRGLSGDTQDELAPLLGKKSGGEFRRPRNKRAKMLGRIVYWPSFFLVVAPIMLFVCLICWGFVITIPMAKLTWALVKLLYLRPLEINFRSAPKVIVPTPGSPSSGEESGDTTLAGGSPGGGYTMKRAHLIAGQVAPTTGPKSTVLLCTYRAIGLQYYKYTVGGVNIIFINLVPLVFFTIVDAFLILPAVEKGIEHGRMPSPLIALLTSQVLIFVLALASVIPLSYFIGMAVASISAQSSIGMGAVINATFGSVIEVILYGIALTQGKGRLVEGSIVGSILAGVLLMPGASMCSGAFKRKEQKFNAKSAGVTSTMLIMAIIGTLTPTMIYQTYGSFELHCQGCPAQTSEAWMCDHCYYEHPDPASDPFYQDQVKTLMYACAVILLLSYLIGLWFSLRTHASQIWQNPQQLMKPEEAMHPAHKAALLQRITPNAMMEPVLPLHKTNGGPGTTGNSPSASTTLRVRSEGDAGPRMSSGTYNLPAGYTPFLETMDQDVKSNHVTPMRLPSTLTTEDFTRAVAVATVSALRHQRSIIGSHAGSGLKSRPMAGGEMSHDAGNGHEDGGEGGSHEAPSWTRGVSAGVLLACTLLYAVIAEILVDVVDVVLAGSGIDEKFLGLSLFALVPNTTEFMNAMSFALNGNIALSMEIGSAYALQVCLLQIPAMVAFSAFYDPGNMGELVDTFTLIFPRWDVIAIILSIFLLTYTYIEARSNYHRGSILVLAYVVLIMGFWFAPPRGPGGAESGGEPDEFITGGTEMVRAGFGAAMSKLWV